MFNFSINKKLNFRVIAVCLIDDITNQSNQTDPIPQMSFTNKIPTTFEIFGSCYIYSLDELMQLYRKTENARFWKNIPKNANYSYHNIVNKMTDSFNFLKKIDKFQELGLKLVQQLNMYGTDNHNCKVGLSATQYEDLCALYNSTQLSNLLISPDQTSDEKREYPIALKCTKYGYIYENKHCFGHMYSLSDLKNLYQLLADKNIKSRLWKELPMYSNYLFDVYQNENYDTFTYVNGILTDTDKYANPNVKLTFEKQFETIGTDLYMCLMGCSANQHTVIQRLVDRVNDIIIKQNYCQYDPKSISTEVPTISTAVPNLSQTLINYSEKNEIELSDLCFVDK